MSLRARLEDIPLPPTEEEAWEEFAGFFDPEKRYEKKKKLLTNYWQPYIEKTMMVKKFVEKTQKRSPIPVKEASKFENKVEPKAATRDERLLWKYERWLDKEIVKERPLPKKLEAVAQAFQKLLQDEINKMEIPNLRPILTRRGNYLAIVTHEYELFYQLIHFEKSENPLYMRFRAFDSEELRQFFSESAEANSLSCLDVTIEYPHTPEDSAYNAYVQLLKHRLIGTFKSNQILCKQLNSCMLQ